MKNRWFRQRLEKRELTKPFLCLLVTITLMFAMTAAAYANPSGGQVKAGAATVKSNQATRTMTITQSTDKVVIDWQSFNIGSKETVRYLQPSKAAIALNRVTGWLPTTVYGKLTANGQVFLINPSGILFGSTAQVNVGGLVASTLNMSNRDFLGGRYSFSGTGSLVINQGKITASDGGYVALIGPWAQNQGVIVANMGTVALGAGTAVTLDMTGDGLVNLAVNKAAFLANAANSNLIQADGGKVIMNAMTADFLAGTVVNNSGIIRARSIGSVNGAISLDGGTNGTVVNSGELNAAGVASGGNILLQGKKVTLASSSRIDASGTIGGTLKVSTFGDLTVANPLSAGTNANIVLRADNTGTGNGTVLFSGRGLVLISGNGTAEIYYNPTSYMTPTDYSSKVSGGPLTAYMLVNDVYQLQNVNTNLSGNYALGRNIDASVTSTWNGGAGFEPLGDFSATYFEGKFNGDGRIIDKLYINRPGYAHIALFNLSHATVTNLGITNVYVYSTRGAAGLAATSFNDSIISNCYVTGAVSGGFEFGGLVASNGSGSIIKNSYSTATVSGSESYIGGLVGENLGGTISNSYSTGAVSGLSNVGGLVGINFYGGTISNSYSTGAVSAVGGTVGGLVAVNGDGYPASNHIISNSYHTGAVSGTTDVGGLVGINDSNGTISNSYNKGTVNGSGDIAFDVSYWGIGGLVGQNKGSITTSYNAGNVSGSATLGIYKGLGGLVGVNVEGSSISNSYNKGSVSGISTFGSYNGIGGLVGVNGGAISYSHSVGAVSGNANVGGLVGSFYNGGSTSNSYWDVTTSGQTMSAGGTGLTTAQMQTQASFVGWDFTNVWNIAPGTYPYLRWQTP